MSTTYTGSPSAAQAPSPAPSLGTGAGEDPVGALPADGDTLNASSVIQALKVPLDWIAFLRRKLYPFSGVRTWASTIAFVTDDTVVDPYDGLTYKAIANSTDYAPHSNPSKWERWGHTDDETKAIAALETTSTGDISATAGAAVARAFMLSFNSGALKRIEFSVTNVPVDSTTTIDLSSSATKFASYVETGIVSLNSGINTYGGQVGIVLDVDANENKMLIWHKKGAGDPATSATVSVSLMGY